MKDFITNEENKLQELLSKLGFHDDNVMLLPSSKREFGDYQYNGSMKIAKKLGKNPREIAEQISQELKDNTDYKLIEVAGPGFINITFSTDPLVNYLNEVLKTPSILLGEKINKKVLIDYGGANVAKVLHVGHLRAANIGEAIKRLATAVGMDVIGDVHLGDWGLQMGLVIYEIRERYPDLIYFKEDYDGTTIEPLPLTNEDLENMYPVANAKAKENSEIMEEAHKITALLQEGYAPYYNVWKGITKISISYIKEMYDKFNANFELWNGEEASFSYVPAMLDMLKEKGLAVYDAGALIMDVSEEDDQTEIPPLLLLKSDGASLYGTTDLATLVDRMTNYKLDDVWYVVDKRQGLHFKQVFRAAYKSEIVPKTVNLEHMGFGTMNGKDGRPFKTRDGGTMSLANLLDIVKEETRKHMTDLVPKEELEETIEIIAVATIKYSDLLTNISTDYIFDIEKFCDMNGKTAPYLLYSTIRMKSLLNKAETSNYEYKQINSESEKEIVLNLLELPSIIKKSLNTKSLHEITDYLYRLTNSYNNFYSSTRILTEENEDLKQSWIALTKIVYETNIKLLDILGIKVPNKM